MSFITWRQQLGDPECPYAERWVLDFGKLGSVRLHHWFRSDDKRAKHDHPADFITLVLKGSYEDWSYHDCRGRGAEKNLASLGGDDNWYCSACGQRLRNTERGCDFETTVQSMTTGTIRKRSAEHRHTVAVAPGGCWTLLYFFPDRRVWGFWTRRKDNGILRFRKSNKYFFEKGHHPCDQP